MLTHSPGLVVAIGGNVYSILLQSTPSSTDKLTSKETRGCMGMSHPVKNVIKRSTRLVIDAYRRYSAGVGRRDGTMD
jgi:hypothetical protein